jgi:hypothetical protein
MHGHQASSTNKQGKPLYCYDCYDHYNNLRLQSAEYDMAEPYVANALVYGSTNFKHARKQA